jgi:heterodisulfide reductase subunit D
MQFVLRREMIKMGHHPPESLPRKPAEPYSDARILSQLQNETNESGASKDEPNPVDVVYFPGCNAVLRPYIVSGLLDIFDRLGVEYVTLAGSYGNVCCGSPHLMKGNAEKAEKAAKKLISAVARFKPGRLIIKCPGCMNRLKNIFSRFISFDFKLQYVSEFLNEHLDRMAFTQTVEKTVTLHDSCNLGRGCGDYESVRKLLGAIPGIRLVEMARNRENASCCYSAPAYNWYPDVGKRIRSRTLRDAGDSGAGILATECGGCMRNLVAERHEANPEVPFNIEDFITIVADAMGIVYPRNPSE